MMKQVHVDDQVFCQIPVPGRTNGTVTLQNATINQPTPQHSSNKQTKLHNTTQHFNIQHVG